MLGKRSSGGGGGGVVTENMTQLERMLDVWRAPLWCFTLGLTQTEKLSVKQLTSARSHSVIPQGQQQ